jgi:hypothetical protein
MKIINLVGYLSSVSVLRLYNADDRMTNEYGRGIVIRKRSTG